MELISRVKALLRRIDRVKKEDLNYGTIRIDVSRHTVQVDGNEVELTYKEYEILKYLMKNRGIVLTRDSLMEKIWATIFEHGQPHGGCTYPVPTQKAGHRRGRH